MTQSRWRSPVLWTSLVALVLFTLKNFNVFTCIGVSEDTFREFFNMLFALLIGFGILNNPTDKVNF